MSDKHNPNMKRIHTPRLVLKALKSSDCDNLGSILGDPQTAYWFDSFVINDRETLLYIINKWNNDKDLCQYGIFEKGSDRVIGVIQVWTEDDVHVRTLGYALSKDYRGKGYMTEAVKAVCERLFYNHMVKTIMLWVRPVNLPSQAVARKAGFIKSTPPNGWGRTTFLKDEPVDRLILTRQRFAVINAVAS